MKTYILRYAILLFVFLSTNIYTNAQDIIIKKNKDEVKSKVIELTEDFIKYRKWDMQDGPVFNIKKDEVFMIVYSNGKREVIKSTENIKDNRTENITASQEKSSIKTDLIDTAIDYKTLKVKYRPLRFYTGLQSPFSIGSDYEFRLIKNTLNIGAGYQYSFPKNDYIAEMNSAIIFLNLYAPLNRLAGNYKKQDLGLFLFGNVGYRATTIKSSYDYKSVSSGGITWRLGADYTFGSAGITLFTEQFLLSYIGLVLTF